MAMRASLVELAAADIQLHPAEAAALVSTLCRRSARGELHGIPSPGIIRLTSDGDVLVEGPTTTGEAGVARMAQLLSDLLPPFDAAPEFRASGGLRLVVARALGAIDLPPYESLEDFSSALDRFAAPDLPATARCLFRAWEEKRRRAGASPAQLTISDVRRARRATGLTLDDISAVAEVPAAELRQLEWGDFRAWPRTADGRARIVRYARAAGLDEQVVLSIAWPMVERLSSSIDSRPAAVNALVPSGPQALTRVEPKRRRRGSGFWLPWIAAVAAMVLLAVTTIALVRKQTAPAPDSVAAERIVPEATVPLAVAEPEPPPAAQPEPQENTPPPVVRAVARSSAPPAKTVRHAGKPAAAKSAAKPAAGKQGQTRRQRTHAFFGKELFRIVFR
jgi:cytoskeletal protein RodZ